MNLEVRISGGDNNGTQTLYLLDSLFRVIGNDAEEHRRVEREWEANGSGRINVSTVSSGSVFFFRSCV